MFGINGVSRSLKNVTGKKKFVVALLHVPYWGVLCKYLAMSLLREHTLMLE